MHNVRVGTKSLGRCAAYWLIKVCILLYLCLVEQRVIGSYPWSALQCIITSTHPSAGSLAYNGLTSERCAE
eukprot:scaffold64083_cov19-Prasinocladus_malaysianus.AAC.1